MLGKKGESEVRRGKWKSSARHHTKTYTNNNNNNIPLPFAPHTRQTRLLTRINPRDEMCQKLTSQVKNEHDEEKNAKTQGSMRLANTGETLKVIAVLELTKLFINLIKALLESDLGTFSSEKRWFFGCHGRIVVVLERKEKKRSNKCGVIKLYSCTCYVILYLTHACCCAFIVYWRVCCLMNNSKLLKKLVVAHFGALSYISAAQRQKGRISDI